MSPCAVSMMLCLLPVDGSPSLTGRAPAPATSAGLALAAAVGSWARQHADADAMTIAAGLVQAHTRAGFVEVEGEDAVDAQDLYDEAAALAVDDLAMARVLQRRSTSPRGIAQGLGDRGPIGRLMLIAPGRPLSFSLTARGSEQALLHVGPTGGGDLDVRVADDRGRQVCAAQAPGRPVLCSWRPAFTTTYRVRITVLSAAPVTTVITSN